MLRTRIQGLLTYLKFEHLEEEESKLEIDAKLQKSYLKIEHLEEEKSCLSYLKVDVELQKSYLKIEHLEEENLKHWRKLWMLLEKKHFHC
jgi:hypothetical protein